MRAIVRILGVGVLVLAMAAPSLALSRPHRQASAVARGACSDEARWRLALVTDGGRLGVAFRVDASVAGELWRVAIAHDRDAVFLARRVATEPDGIFGVRLVLRNHEGPDLVRARAVNTVTGETCVARAVI
jgi:hypothetical protein